MENRLYGRLIVLIAAVCVCLPLVACGKGGDGGGTPAAPAVAQSESLTAAATDPATEAATETPTEGDFSIATPYAVLKYPAKWQNKVTVDVTAEKISFTADGAPVFDLLINSDEGEVLGTLIGDDESVVISVVEYDTTDEEFAQMIDDINVIQRNLMADYDFTPGERVDSSTFDIWTSVVTLKYPAKWADRVSVTLGDAGVYFTCGEVRLFDIVFAECEGYLLGTYGAPPIYIIDYPVEGDELCAMQEDVNVILQNLMKDENFTLNMN